VQREVNPQKTKEREKRQALQQQTQTLTEQMAQMQTMMSQLQTPAPGQNPQHMGSTTYGTSPQARQLEELWETDPRRAMQAEMMMGFQWYDQTGGQVEDEMDRAAKEFKDFDKFRPDVRKYLRTMPPQERPKPNVIRLAYFAVRGQNVDSLWKEKQEELFRKIKSGEQVAGFNSGTTPSSTAPKQKSLNEEQTKAAEAMGVPLDEYLKYVR